MKEETIAFFDIETKRTFIEIDNNWNNLKFIEKEKERPRIIPQMGLATACIISDSDEVYFFDEGSEIELIKKLDSFDKIVGHNLLNFDYLVLSKYSKDIDIIKHFAPKTIDILNGIKKVTNEFTKLDDLARLNLNKSKSGEATDAPKAWRNGEKDKVRAYCKNDVEICRDLYFYGKQTGKIKYYHKEYGEIKDINEIPCPW